MGLPIKLTAAVNANKVIHKCLQEGILTTDIRAIPTLASAMDIQACICLYMTRIIEKLHKNNTLKGHFIEMCFYNIRERYLKSILYIYPIPT